MEVEILEGSAEKEVIKCPYCGWEFLLERTLKEHMEVTRRVKAPVESVAYTFCDACNQVPYCGIKAYLVDGQIVRIDSWEGFPNTPLCSKGFATLQRQYHPQRLGYPLKRTNPKDSPDPGWIRISWEEAYDIIVSKMREIRDRYGPEAVLFYCGDPKEMRPAVSRLATVFGSPNFGTESSTCFRAAALASQLMFGLIALGSLPTEDTKTVLIWGMNPAWSSPFNMRKLFAAKERGVKFIVIDTRKTPVADKLADIHLQPRPGTDAAVALGMMNVIIERKLYDEEFVENWVHGFGALKEYVKDFTPERVKGITWVPADKIVEAAVLFATNKPGTLMAGASTLTHTTNAVQTVRSILTLIALTGNFDVPGGVTVPTNPLPFRSHDMGDPDFIMEEEKIKMKDKRADREYVPVWAEIVHEQIQVNFLPEYVKDGRIRMAILFGANVTIWPQFQEYQEALKNMEFVVAVDYFLRPWTHNYVDIVLPAATNYERFEPFIWFGRKIYVRKPVVKPYLEAKSDWQIIFDLAVRLGYAEEFWGGDTKKGLDFILQKVGVTMDEIPIPGGKEIPAPGPEEYRKYEKGLLRKDKEPGFPTPTGKVEVWSTILEKHGYDPLPVFKEPEESPVSRPDLAKKYPLILITGSRVPMYTHSKWREISWLRELMPYPTVNINPEDAEKRGISEGDLVIVENSHGRIKVRAHITYLVPPGVVDVFHGWAMIPEAHVNALVPRYFDPISGFPTYKAVLCEVRKA
ncbi:molybdopterin-dependent oxidoreductase [Candidatus Bathyarchaeota archaeon]|nr:molybdopterin-dependent oxidoreductase [Candidatus Bathyarchaeota archaeon]